jgi:hypothetical protein
MTVMCKFVLYLGRIACIITETCFEFNIKYKNWSVVIIGCIISFHTFSPF